MCLVISSSSSSSFLFLIISFVGVVLFVGCYYLVCLVSCIIYSLFDCSVLFITEVYISMRS